MSTGNPVLHVWPHCWLDLGTSKAACGSTEAPGPCRKTLPAIVEGGCGETRRGDSVGWVSARKDSEKTHESAETLRQKEGAWREVERVGAREAAADTTEIQISWVTLGQTLRWAFFRGHTYCCEIQNNLSGLLEAQMSWHPEFLYL